MYGGPVTVQGLERLKAYQFRLRVSAEWGAGRFIHRSYMITLDPGTAALQAVEVVPTDAH